MPDVMERFDDLPVLADLGASLRAAMLRAEAAAPAPAVAPHAPQVRRRRRWTRSFPALGTVLVLGAVGTAAAAGTLALLRGSPIPAPRAADLQAPMTARAETQKVLSLRALDPGGAPAPFALRVGTSQSGLACVTVGQVDDGAFGIVGDDGKFRTLPATLVDGCGKITGKDAAVAGARILDATNYRDVRSVVYGLGGPELRRASVVARGVSRDVPVRDGAFVTALRGYPEDQGLELQLQFASGRTVTHVLGRGRMTVLDPSGPAWILMSGSMSPRPGKIGTTCVQLRRARDGQSEPATSQICGRWRAAKDSRPSSPLYFNIRTFRPGEHGGNPRELGVWSWHRAPARTIVWGYAAPGRFKSATVTAAGGVRAPVHLTINGAFAVVLPATVAANTVRLSTTLRSGSVQRYDRPLPADGKATP